MYLKALEIFGFKSFADKSSMPLRPGITCIVGPNGCGKSNVADSIRWCIGEMSWKSLRMPSMLGVIFSGTTRRKPLNMAEVSMTFDNSERKLPLDFSEVTVTRKIYRSEESEYFINKVPCRLKDIRELFLDTGVGTDGYAIIDQGQVERLLQATPEELREMFEEAAGVSKYKAKREEALRRLEKVDSDINRLSDSMTILREQLKKLEAEARKARLQQKYREELKAAEIALLLDEHRNFLSQTEKAEKTLTPIVSQQGELQAAITAAEGVISAAELNISKKKADLTVLWQELNALKLEKNSLETAKSHNERSLQDIEASKQSLETSEKANGEKLLRLEPYLRELEAKIKAGKSSLDGLKQKAVSAKDILSKTQEQLSLAEKEFSELSEEINKSYSREIQLSQFLARSKSDTSHLDEQIKSLVRDGKILDNDRKKLEKQSSENNTKIEDLKRNLKEEQKKNSASEEKVKSITIEIAKTDKRLSEIKAETAALNARLETLLAQAGKNPYWTGQKAVLKAEITGIAGTLRQMLKIKKENLNAAEEAIGRYLDSVVCEDFASAEKAIAYLKETGKGRCRFLVLGKAPETIATEASQGIFSIVRCQEKAIPLVSALSMQAYPDGNGNIRGGFFITGGASDIVPQEPYWGAEGEIKEKKADLQSENRDLEEKRQKLNVELEKERRQAVISREKTVKINLEINTASNQLKSFAERIRINKERASSILKTRQKTEDDLKKAREMSQQFEKSLKDVKNSLENLKTRQNSVNEKKQKMNEEFARQKENYAVSKAALDNFNANFDAAGSEYRRVEEDLRSCVAEKQHFETRRTELEAKKTSLLKDLRESEEKLVNLNVVLTEKDGKAHILENEINAMSAQNSRDGEALSHKKGLFSDNEKARIRLETEITALKARAEETVRRLADSWNISLEEAGKAYGEIETDSARVAFLRKRVASVGPVNMTAPEELSALSERFTFLESQSEDLKKAKADLRAAIARINASTRENFSIAFEKVRGYFKEIYSLLFNGGEAELMLTLPENLLETGVEIMAHPPGKRLVSITQLSGGEKALTALALLFSFFRVSPSPFCIMDETDAPLDEANVERFVKMLKEFSSFTQFLVITHNKRTMESAETLYGVTMEELGVSKLVSVDLKNAADMADNI